MLPHVLAFNAPCVETVMVRLAEVLPGSDGDAVRGLNLLVSRLGVQRRLGESGMRKGDVDAAVEIALASQYWNPRPVERGPLREVLRRCWAGEQARADL